MQDYPQNLTDVRMEAERLRRGRGSAPKVSTLPSNPKHTKRNKERERQLQLPLL